MQRYRNLGGDSGVLSYEAEPGAITVEFSDGSVYLYTDESAGAANIAEMQRLAANGQGLCTFINRVVRNNYARMIR